MRHLLPKSGCMEVFNGYDCLYNYYQATYRRRLRNISKSKVQDINITLHLHDICLSDETDTVRQIQTAIIHDNVFNDLFEINNL